MSYDKHKVAHKVTMAIKQINGSWALEGIPPDTRELLPEVAIKPKGKTNSIHCYSVADKRFIKISRGQKACIIDEMADEEYKCLIYTWDGYLIEIDTEEIIHTGFD